MMSRVAALVTALLLATSLAAQTPTGGLSITVPNTPAGTELREWLAAFNSGDTAQLRAHYARYAIRASLEQAVQRLRIARAYELVSIERSEPRLIEFVVKERATGGLWLGVHEMKPAGTPGMRQYFLTPILPGTTVANFRIDAATRARVIDVALAQLDSFYVLPELAKRIGDTVRARQQRGAYDSITNGASLATLLTDDFREVYRDAHLRIAFLPRGLNAVMQAASDAAMRTGLLNTNCSFERAEIQAGNVGYVKLNGLPDPRICASMASTSMNTIANADVLIVDLRDSGGGDPAMETHILSYLFDKRTHVYDVWSRRPEKTEPHWTSDKVAGKRFGGRKPVYVLVSPRTFSGGESFAFTLQQQKRATIVGEPTGGGAHGVRPVPLDDRFRLFLPFAKKIDAVSKSNWEQTGVIPDVRVPAAFALDTVRALTVSTERLGTAYVDDQSRRLVARARRERLAQDSSLKSYEATGRQRTTVTAGIGGGAQRTAFRSESAFHIHWRDGAGAEIQLTGARVGMPIVPAAEADELKNQVTNPDMSPIPYSSGQEPLWPVQRTTRGQRDDDDRLVHPLATGAEAHYTYESGGTTRIGLPDGRQITLHELKVRPRSPQSNLAVGSLWFDDATGQLVRAAYRLAAPLALNMHSPELGVDGEKPNPITAMIIKGLVSPFKVEISGVAVEYGLYQGRYWLPRSRSVEARGQVSFAKVGVEIAQSFTYPAINGPAVLTPVVLNEPTVGRIVVPDSLTGDRARKWRDSVWIARNEVSRDSLSKAQCDATGYRVVARMRFDLGLPVAVKYPCDLSVLASSPDFTGPLYAANEDILDTKMRDDLLNRALPFGAQAAITLGALPRPDFQYGLSMTRYNRIEGLSSGIHVEQQLGGGYSVGVTGRIGTADHEPNGDLSFARTNLNTTITLRGYNRLVSANDWGNPLSFGSSVSTLLFGRDEGFYYRASGAELTWTSVRGIPLNWRLFAEQERTARQRTDYTWGASFVPNIQAATGPFAGAAARWLHTTGVEPRGLRTITNLRLEAATGDSTYGRGAVDVTLMRTLVGRLSGALTLSGGSSVGALPAQRRWFLGGTQTIRGQSADPAQSGNAFWMTRAELASEQMGYRVALFSDLGWVGDRSVISSLGRPLSSAGVGFSGFDGLIRLDVARGFHPRKQTRIAFYLGGKF